MRTALTIAGSDSGGGAGIQADIKTFEAHGVFGMSAITAVTAQNTLGVSRVLAIPPDMVVAQIDAVVSDLGAAATKIGMLANAAIASAVADAIRRHALPHVVLDTVMVAKGGARLIDEDAIDVIRTELIPLAAVVTANMPEAEALTGLSLRTVADLRTAARALVEAGARAVVVKGGHLDGPAIDVFDDGRTVHEFRVARIATRHSHGTGCTLAAAIAARLARGDALVDAVRLAKDYVTRAIAEAPELGHGHGPLKHGVYTLPMSLPRLAVLREPLSLAQLSADLERDIRNVGEGCGALCSFVGVVRATHRGREVQYLEYEAFDALALKAFAVIESEVAEAWPSARMALHHRVGRLEIGDASVVIVAAAAHRAESFQVCRYVIERVKQIAPVWKHEFFRDGAEWVEGALADPDDQAARARARGHACA
jgi:hydroxymethylpyrimidine/phosphomethylpyrimidine kinase